MRSRARAVVIGGGVVGCSVLYHLAKAGWTDVMLIERSELTSGSSWHAAGGFHTLNGDPNVAKLQAYTVGLYRELEELSGQSCGLHLTGGVMMAGTPERMDFLRLAHAKGRCLGMQTEIITPGEAAAMFPLMDPSPFRRRALGPGRGPPRPGRHHPRLRQGGAGARRDDRAPQPRRRADPGARRHLERRHRARHRRGRARGQRRRALGARGRADGRARAAAARDGAHVPADRADRGGGGVQRGDGARDGRRPRPARRDLHAAGARRRAARHLRAGLQAMVAEDDALGLRPRAAAARPRPDRALAGDRLPPLSGAGERRDQAGDQRPLHLRPRRQPAGRAGAGADQLLGRLRGDGGLQPGRRRRPRRSPTG